MTDEQFVNQLRSVGALKEGHFLLASGLHSDRYIEKFDLLRQPRATEKACGRLIEAIGDLGDVDLVVGPTTGGILLAFEIARQLGLPSAYAEREYEGSSTRVFKRGTVIEPGTRVLLVDDILTTGKSLREPLATLNECDADVKVIAVLVDRSGGTQHFGAPLISLVTLDIETYQPDMCPMCKAGVPLVKPGTTLVKQIAPIGD